MFKLFYKRVLEVVVVVCELTWWRKPENPRRTTDPPHDYTQIRNRAAAVASKYFTSVLSNMLCYVFL